jgi:hypothetical protein
MKQSPRGWRLVSARSRNDAQPPRAPAEALASGAGAAHYSRMIQRRESGVRPLQLAKFAEVAACLFAVACGGSGTAERGDDPQTSVNASSGYPPAATAMPTTDVPATGTGPDLRAVNSWVDGASNGVGIQGAFFTYVDHSDITNITAKPEQSTTGGYCVSGTAAQVMNMNFASTYGATAALNLSQLPNNDAVNAYNADEHGVVGFGFDIVGNTGGALRFIAKQFSVHDGFCINMVPECATDCSVEFALSDMHQNCWAAGGALPDTASLSAIEWQITTNENAPVDFDFCIENLHAVLSQGD